MNHSITKGFTVFTTRTQSAIGSRAGLSLNCFDKEAVVPEFAVNQKVTIRSYGRKIEAKIFAIDNDIYYCEADDTGFVLACTKTIVVSPMLGVVSGKPEEPAQLDAVATMSQFEYRYIFGTAPEDRMAIAKALGLGR